MQTFTDNQGKSWSIEITVATVKELKRDLEVDLMTIAEQGDDLLGKLASDPVLLVDALWVVCRDQAEADGIGDEAFAGRLGGDSLDEAIMALMEAIADFFPKARRQMLRKMLAKAREAESRLLDQINQKLDSEEMDAEIDRQLASYGDGSTSSPASSG